MILYAKAFFNVQKIEELVAGLQDLEQDYKKKTDIYFNKKTELEQNI
jgi:hypothetical protein